MATDYSTRIGKVTDRRTGTGSSHVAKSASLTGSTIVRDLVTESYERKTRSSSFQYALVSMQQVDAEYTAISYREANRVTKQIHSGLIKQGSEVAIELQGSLPLNVHLRRVSDVDMLDWPSDFLTFDKTGIAASSYTTIHTTAASRITTLRAECCAAIRSAFSAARVDDSGAKCITVSEGSLLREIDVVPSVINENANYQKTENDDERGVQIYDKKMQELITNYPFKVRALINAKDSRTGGGCKKAIRLLKNMKEDADTPITLSSFNIMSLVHAMLDTQLVHYSFHEGKIVASLQDWFWTLVHNEAILRRLDTVDGSRKIGLHPLQ